MIRLFGNVSASGYFTVKEVKNYSKALCSKNARYYFKQKTYKEVEVLFVSQKNESVLQIMKAVIYEPCAQVRLDVKLYILYKSINFWILKKQNCEEFFLMACRVTFLFFLPFCGTFLIREEIVASKLTGLYSITGGGNRPLENLVNTGYHLEILREAVNTIGWLRYTNYDDSFSVANSTTVNFFFW